MKLKYDSFIPNKGYLLVEKFDPNSNEDENIYRPTTTNSQQYTFFRIIRTPDQYTGLFRVGSVIFAISSEAISMKGHYEHTHNENIGEVLLISEHNILASLDMEGF